MDTGKPTRLPLYVQISELLHREIAAGHWLAGERLPTESKLAQDLEVAVGTLRKALAVLEDDGLLERRQGSGTYVRKPPTGGAIYQFFRLELLNGGGMPTATTLSVEKISSPVMTTLFAQKSPEAVSSSSNTPDTTALGLQASSFWRIRRLRYLNRQPVAAEEIFIAGAHAESLSPDIMHESLYTHYRQAFNFWITHVADEVSCQCAPDWACQTLQLPNASVLGWVTRRGWANSGDIGEFSQTWFNPDVCRYMARWS